MRLAGFSTLGCPGSPIDEVLALATRHGADLVQLRCADDEPVNTGLSSEARRHVADAFAAADVGFGALATYVKISDPDFLDPLAEHIQLAADLGAGALRLFPGDIEPETGRRRLHSAVRIAEGTGVRLTVETHDAYLRGEQLAELLAGNDEVKAVWDVLHTIRDGESVTETLAVLGPRLAEVQIKDVDSLTNLRPLVPGTGVLPLAEALSAVAADELDIPVIFEHETKWRADADPFEQSLVEAMRLARATD